MWAFLHLFCFEESLIIIFEIENFDENVKFICVDNVAKDLLFVSFIKCVPLRMLADGNCKNIFACLFSVYNIICLNKNV